MITRGGHKIYNAMVESVLIAWLGVIKAAVVPRPCPILGERVHAVVKVKVGALSERDLRRYCAGQLSDYQRP